MKTALKFNEEALAIAPEDSLVLVGSARIYSNIGNNLGNPDYNSLGKTDEALNYCKNLFDHKKVSRKRLQ
ncbi:MAG: hypothetical protein WKF84_23805 [Pyrinomonadaceae bacterium]